LAAFLEAIADNQVVMPARSDCRIAATLVSLVVLLAVRAGELRNAFSDEVIHGDLTPR
jgi:hypothetical protein